MVVDVGARGAFRHSPWAIVIVAFVLRVGAMQVLHSYRFPTSHNHYLFGTEMGRVARSLVTGHGFASPLHGETGPTAMVGPIYPFVIAATFTLWGIYTTASAVALLTLNALLSALTAAVVYLTGRSAFDGTIGLCAAWTWALFPPAIYWPIAWIWDTNLSALLFAVIFLTTIGLGRSISTWRAAGYGALWGTTVLTNTTYLPVLPFFVAWLGWRAARGGGSWFGPTAAALLAFGIILAPWIVRNELVFGHFLLRSNLGLELAQGNSPGAHGPRAWWLHPAFNAAEMTRYRRLGELRYMAEKQRQALDFIVRQPGRFARATGSRVLFFWFGAESPAQLFRFPEVSYGLTSIFALVGLGLALARRSSTSLLFATVVTVFPLVYYVTHPDARFRDLIEPQLFVLAAFGAVIVWRRTAGRDRAFGRTRRETPRKETEKQS